jgi:hypothetical protein
VPTGWRRAASEKEKCGSRKHGKFILDASKGHFGVLKSVQIIKYLYMNLFASGRNFENTLVARAANVLPFSRVSWHAHLNVNIP